jgi:Amt family ammonium transporter
MELRADRRAEGLGMDVSQHGEEAYTSGEGSVLVLSESLSAPAPAPVLAQQAAH